MNQKQWDKWKELPATVEFFRFLKDHREKIARDVAEAVSIGEFIAPDYLATTIETCGIYADLETVDYDRFEEHYKSEIDEKESA